MKKLSAKVLYIHHAQGWGGAPKSMAMQIVELLGKSEMEVLVVLLKNSNVANHLKERNIPFVVASGLFYSKVYRYFANTETQFIPLWNFPKWMFYFFIWFLSRNVFAPALLKKYDADIIHLNSSVLTDFLKPSSNKAKTIMHVREPLRDRDNNLFYRFFRGQMKRYSSKVLAISQDNLRRIQLPEITELIFDPFDYSIEEAIEETYSSKSWVYCGGGQELKGFDVIFNALPFLDPRIKIYLLGNYSISIKGKIFNEIKSYIKRDKSYSKKLSILSGHPQIEIVGMKGGISDELKKSCGLISPITEPHFLRPVLESYFHSKTVIVSNVAGMDEIVKDGETGILVENGDSRSLANTINELSLDKVRCSRLGKNGFRFAESTFQYSNQPQFFEIYYSLLRN